MLRLKRLSNLLLLEWCGNVKPSGKRNKWYRRSPINLYRFIGRTGASGFMEVIPKMLEGPQGLYVWGVVVITGVVLNQFRLYKKDQIKAANEAKCGQ